ncbi:hypothetical protein BB559_006766 [Furculomyces boomerangus]|uniref:Peptidase A1 domain-containing protein n=2 Tax=Harpellales TaxID=61421 RepID=A0A2T9Y0R1_9FUNG|nr:hypothetical protein BB559_006766 [Furculomyces boomerangus]PWA00409.1 hypothetical protein BB558_003538 [Smittium angustum]
MRINVIKTVLSLSAIQFSVFSQECTCPQSSSLSKEIGSSKSSIISSIVTSKPALISQKKENTSTDISTKISPLSEPVPKPVKTENHSSLINFDEHAKPIPKKVEEVVTKSSKIIQSIENKSRVVIPRVLVKHASSNIESQEISTSRPMISSKVENSVQAGVFKIPSKTSIKIDIVKEQGVKVTKTTSIDESSAELVNSSKESSKISSALEINLFSSSSISNEENSSLVLVESEQNNLENSKVEIHVSNYPVFSKELVYKNFFYFVEAMIGYDTVFMLAIDTEADSLWVPSINCGGNCSNKKRYNPSLSLLKEHVSSSVSFKEGVYNFNGDEYRDSVTLGSKYFSKFKFYSVTPERSYLLQNKMYDGVFGVGLSGDGAYRDENELWTKQQTDQISLYLDKKNPRIFFGIPKKNVYTDGMYWINTINENSFKIEMNEFKIGMKKYNVNTSVLINPKYKKIMVSEKIWQVINSKKHIDAVRQCRLHELPSISFKLGDHDFMMEPQDYVVVDRSECWLAIEQLSYEREVSNTWILGLQFIEKYFTIFDNINNRIGLKEMDLI